MSFSKQQLQKFAHLIRIDVPDETLANMKIDSIIEWIDKLQQIDTTDIQPMLTPVEHALPRRNDIITDENARDKLLKNAPDQTGARAGYFAVPKVMDE